MPHSLSVQKAVEGGRRSYIAGILLIHGIGSPSPYRIPREAHTYSVDRPLNLTMSRPEN
jgi:hypothetical protein